MRQIDFRFGVIPVYIPYPAIGVSYFWHLASLRESRYFEKTDDVQFLKNDLSLFPTYFEKRGVFSK